MFQHSIKTHVLTNFEHLGNIAHLVQELSNLMSCLMKKMPTLTSLKKNYRIGTTAEENKLSAVDKAVVDELKELLSTKYNSFISCKATLHYNKLND